MASLFVEERLPVEICELFDEKLNRSFFILKMTDEERFLASNVGAKLRKNWTTKLTRAVVWDEAHQIAGFVNERGFILIRQL